MIIKQDFSIDYQYDIIFTRDLFSGTNATLNSILTGNSDEASAKIVCIIDEGLANAQPTLVSSLELYVSKHKNIQLLAEPLLVSAGEAAKNTTREFIRTLKMIDSAKVDRHAFVIAIGGGAVLDMAGFAAAVAHRGIRHIRIPTTTLSQNDSGIGVKNGINYFGKKNFLGTFAPPFAVINDLNLLNTLNDRDWRSGIAEAVKVALIKDADFFQWIKDNAVQLKRRDTQSMERLIIRCAELHAHHISHSDDPFEMGSSRPLDFGHWAAHKLEQLCDFELRHGEAVAIGIALDVCYAAKAGFLNQQTAELIVDLLDQLGFLLFHPILVNSNGDLNPDLLRGLEEFREHLGGQLTIPMISDIGVRFDVHEMT
ncbi:MAG: 3-dehydroquinate synthase, partial [Saprospiraceae bacterium]|nr:3-dehydroquinate synthase [Saprospiraceae bacterium]